MDITGAKQEIEFWEQFVKSDRFLKDWLSDVVTTELQGGQPEVVQAIKNILLVNKSAKVLDVGSGVYSILKGLVPDAQLYQYDVLGDHYKEIFDYKKYNIFSPVPIGVEDLNFEDTVGFDIVHMRNALDHCHDPKKGFQNLLNATKKGGILIIHGFVDEAISENWKGMHQWNITVKDNNLIISGKNGEALKEKSNILGTVKTLDTGKKWFIWIAQK
jgi:SAM-dependent methyltransferase